jgi:hypothetical protein
MGIGSWLRRRRSEALESTIAPSRAPTVERLEGRTLAAGTAGMPDVAVLATRPVDARHVEVTYELRPGRGDAEGFPTFNLAVQRSADTRANSEDRRLATVTIAEGDPSRPNVDLDGRPVTAPGMHRIEVEIPEGLRLHPGKPYVLAVADPEGRLAESDESNNVSAFRKVTIAVITHGGLQETPGNRIPAWVNRMRRDLLAQGYDQVIATNWVAESNRPGWAAKQGPRVAALVRRAVDALPEGAAVDLHVIGHSEGAIVNGVALRDMERESRPALDAGYIRETMIDPHAANNGLPLKQYSTKDSFMGWVARKAINDYQGRAKDPPPLVPGNVDEAEVYYQHTYFALAPGDSQRWFNLWGQVPVYSLPGAPNVQYADITGPGIAHSGPYGVVEWYHEHVVPTLGDAAPFVNPARIDAAIDPRDGEVVNVLPAWHHVPERLDVVAHTASPRFEGTAAPGASLRLTAVRSGDRSSAPIRLGEAVADAQGRWQLDSRALPRGRYRVFTSAVIDGSAQHPRVKLTPRVRFGTLTIDARPNPAPTLKRFQVRPGVG